jgi:phosphocarrier protein HPr
MPESYEVTVTLDGDLHARPAGALSVAAGKFEAVIELAVGASRANAKSVLAVMQLGASSGQQVTVRATGPDAHQAAATLAALLTTP